MSICQNPIFKSRQYLPAVLKNTKSRGWFIEYSVCDIGDGRLKRRYVCLNILAKRFRNRKTEFKMQANKMVCSINYQLSEGIISVTEKAIEKVQRDVLIFKDNNATPKVSSTTFDSTERVMQQMQSVAAAITPKSSPVILTITSNLPTDDSLDEQSVSEPIIQVQPLKKVGRPAKVKEVELPRKQTPLQKVIELFLAEKEKELRPATLICYRSFCRMFGEWAKKHTPKILMSDFDKEKAVRYMDYVQGEREVSSRTYNNHMKMGRALFSWAKEKCYTDINPFEQLKVKRVFGKKRILVPDDVRKRITEYFSEHNPGMLLVAQLVYASAIRPKEIMSIKIGDIQLSERCIRITEENAKNHHERRAVINSQILDELLKLNLDRYPLDAYLIGDGYSPSKKQIAKARFRKDWDKMRKALGLPAEMQLYSLRDTGLTNLSAAGVDAVTIMKHADHHDLSITTRYVRHQDKDLGEKVFDKLQF